MKRKMIIAAVSLVCIGIVLILLRFHFFKSENVIIRFPNTKLEEGERIICATINFESASINSIRNIPAGWEFNLELDPPPNPRLVGCITVGAAALGSTKELPYFEVARYTNEVSEISARATLDIEKYPEGSGKPRQMTIETKAKVP
jgi:hypothetical protein